MPYWRLSSFYLFYFASLGALVPYWSLYLKHQGFSALEIGELMAVLMATKIIAPNVWGWIADHSGRRMGIVRLGSLLAVVTFAGVFLVEGYWALGLVMLLFSFFWNAALPQFEANTLTHLGRDHHLYGNIRLWGSVGFIITVAGLGPLLDIYGPGILPPVLLVLFAGIWVASVTAPERQREPASAAGGSLRSVLRRPEVLALIAVCFLMQASHGPYYTFYTIYMEDFGYSRGVIGQLWALGVVAEIGVFLWMPRLVAAWGLRSLMLAALALTALRWVLIGGLPESVPVMLGAQVLHAASFGVYHAVAIALFHHHFTGRSQGRGQALYSSLSFGAGGAFGSYYSGLVWDGLGPAFAYMSAAALALLGLAVAARWIRTI